ncbi:MAG TPA: serine hydrolase [Dyella sp.]|nr:serine hydrolase [Dyella sp.]
MRRLLSAVLVGVLLLGTVTSLAAADATPFSTSADRVVSRLIDPNGPGVSIVVSKDGKVVYRSSRGMASVELRVPSANGDAYRIGSITKTATAATILLLSRQGKLSLSDRLSKFLSDFPHASDITIAELLNHTAGISDNWNADPNLALNTKTLVDLIAKQPLDFTPGSEWRYSNSGYMLLGAVIEKITGRRWDEVERELVFAPLGMNRTAYYPDDAVVSGLVQGYSVDDRDQLAKPPFVSISGPMSAGALTSTADDLDRLIEGLATDRVFPLSLFDTMTIPARLSDGSSAPYGYGVMLDHVRGVPAFAHNGGIEGFASQYLYLPRQKVTVVVLANSDSRNPNPRAIARQLAALAIGDPYRHFEDATLDPRALNALVGSYEIQGDSRHAISLDSGRLYIQRASGPKQQLMPAQGDILYYAHDGTDYFHVVKSKDGRVIALDFYPDGLSAARHEQRLATP